MNDLISRILSTVDVNKLPTSFDITINEFNDSHVIERLERESWARGYNDDESYDDDGKRSYYCDDPEFLKDLADAAIIDESNASVSDEQNLASFLIGGGFERTIEAERARVIGRAYEITLHLSGDWSSFNWGFAINALGYGRDDDDDEILEAVERLIRDISTKRA